MIEILREVTAGVVLVFGLTGGVMIFTAWCNHGYEMDVWCGHERCGRPKYQWRRTLIGLALWAVVLLMAYVVGPPRGY